MSHFSQPRLARLPSPPRHPFAGPQRGQLRDLYHLEAVLDQLNAAFLSEVMCSIEEEL